MTTVAVALIVAAGPSTIVYALQEQRARANEGLMCVHGGTYPQQMAYDGDLNNNVDVNMHGNDS
jgi:hypothetical protein